MLDIWACNDGDLLERLPDGRRCRFVSAEQRLVRLSCGCCAEFEGWEAEVMWEDNGETDWLDAEELRLVGESNEAS